MAAKQKRIRTSNGKPKVTKYVAAARKSRKYLPGNKPGGYLRKRWSKGPRKFRAGSFTKREYGTIVSDPECLYLGHGLPQSEIFKGVLRCIIKELFDIAGCQISDLLNDPIIDGADTADDHFLYWEYFENFETKLSKSITTTLGPGETVVTAADKVLADFTISFNSNLAQGFKPIFRRVRYIQSNKVTGSEKDWTAQLFLHDYSCKIQYQGYLKMQNVTPAGSSVIATGEDNMSASNVEAVTLHGRAYTTPEWKNGFLIKRRTASSSGNQGLIVNHSTGVILAQSNDLNLNTNSEMFKQPPPGWVFGSKKIEKISIAPGKVYRDKINFYTYISFNKYMSIICDAVKMSYNATTPTSPLLDLGFSRELNFGIAHLFAFEKMLDMRPASAPQITVGYEMDYTVKVGGYYKKPPVQPLVVVQ